MNCNELIIVLKSDSGICLYHQIYEYIKNEIQKGKLKENEKLPSTRSLADFLQVARSTVNLSYEQLLSEGYIEARPQSGYYVCRLENLIEIVPVQSAKLEKAVPAEQKFSLDFSPNAIDMKEFPYNSWKRINKSILTDANSEMFSLGAPQGDEELRETICDYIYAARGIKCAAEQIIIGAGNDYLLLLLEKILGRNKVIAMENPTYQRAYRIFKTFDYEVAAISMDEAGMIPKMLWESDADIAYVMPSHQYPSGITMPIGRQTEILKWACDKENRYIIEDDYDSFFRYRGRPVPAFQSVDEYGKIIYISTFSKVIAPAIRISFMILPESLLHVYRANYSFYSSSVSRIDQRILNEFISKGYFARYLNKMRKIYRDKHDLLLRELEPVKNIFEITGTNAGLHIILKPKYKCKMSSRSIIDRMGQHGIRIYDINDFMIANKAESKNAAILFGYAALSHDEIIEGVKVFNEITLSNQA
ncbi:MAG: PLP-dependent aminotransferase family protein [Lachnospiraceae bacterium]|nr:PLP-dependent aminotransferase family protein [Lachnospiraceae bacterium]